MPRILLDDDPTPIEAILRKEGSGSYEIRLPINKVELFTPTHFIRENDVILNDTRYRIYYKHKIRFNSKIYGMENGYYTVRIEA